MSAVELTRLTRSAAADWVEREQRRTGSRMTAYEIVAQSVGTSSDWLRKFIADREAKQPSWTVGWNILLLYRRVCERVELEANNEREKARLIQRKIDAVIEGVSPLVERAPDAEAPGARAGSSPPINGGAQ